MAQLDRTRSQLSLSERDNIALYARASGDELQRDIATVSSSPIFDGVMRSVGGLFAVLNGYRQVLAVNDAFLRAMEISEGAELLGLRPGEAISCVHADNDSGGCGTGMFCASCGAAIAIVTSLSSSRAEERKCIATIRRGEDTVDLCLRVRSTPTVIGGKRFLMLFLLDITAEEQWAEIDRAFFHDVNNILSGLLGASNLLVCQKSRDGELAKMVHRQTMRLNREMQIQQSLARAESGDYQPALQEVPVAQMLEELQSMYANHPVAELKSLRVEKPVNGCRVVTDQPLALRLLANMLTNAFEASDAGGEVRLWIEEGEDVVTFCVRNLQTIPEAIACRIFQRYFSTKSEHGRGTGTYMMKRFGEHTLGGKVDFTSSEKDGTVFRIALPSAGAGREH